MKKTTPRKATRFLLLRFATPSQTTRLDESDGFAGHVLNAVSY